jgi:hypothetical protein
MKLLFEVFLVLLGAVFVGVNIAAGNPMNAAIWGLLTLANVIALSMAISNRSTV